MSHLRWALAASVGVGVGAACSLPSGGDWFGPGFGPSRGPSFDAGFPPGLQSPPPPQPDLGTTVVQGDAPPPVFGGTLMATKDGTTVVAADPDRNVVYVVDVATKAVFYTVDVGSHALPFRIAEDASHRAHVTLRGTGELATIDLASGKVVLRRPVCAEPRGLAYDAATDRVHVACDGGQLVSFPAAGGDAVRTLALQRGLRDVVIDGGGSLIVSLFRPAKLVRVDSDGTVSPSYGPAASGGFEPDVAWRTVYGPTGVIMAHQAAATSPLEIAPPPPPPTPEAPPPPSPYGPPPGPSNVQQPCVRGAVTSVITSFSVPLYPTLPSSVAFPTLVLPVDVAVSPDGQMALVVSAGSSRNSTLQGYAFLATASTEGPVDAICDGAPRGVGAQFVAAAFIDVAHAVVQSREPAELVFLDVSLDAHATDRVVLSTDSREDTGHVVFHANSGASIACASCHPEGGDDGRVWSFHDAKSSFSFSRRTPSLRGTIAGTAPYHWDAAFADLPSLLDDIYQHRMGGPTLAADQQSAVRGWVESIPRPRQELPSDPAATARGAALFTGKAACNGCHSGPRMTNNFSADVGTGGVFQPPSLIGVSARAPFLHDGRAATLTDRFGSLGGGDAHGQTSTLSASEVSDLVAYLSSL